MQLELLFTLDNEQNFESFSNENGFTFWYSSDFMKFLGYETILPFNKALNKAIAACTTLNINILENFIQIERIDSFGKIGIDYKLSRFACYLIAMNGDVKKKEVAQAQAYFATIAGAVTSYLDDAEKVDRLLTREEISVREKSMAGVVKMAGVENYAYFQNAGYRGMYNKNISELKAIRNIDKNKVLLDFMGKEELAANLFRITQTELKIKNEHIKGQQKLEVTAEVVGKEVRNTMIKISGIAPEDLEKKEDIKNVKKQLKSQNKTLKKIDQKKKK